MCIEKFRRLKTGQNDLQNNSQKTLWTSAQSVWKKMKNLLDIRHLGKL